MALKAIEIFYLFKARNLAGKEFEAIGGSMRKTASDAKKAAQANKELSASTGALGKQFKILSGVLGAGLSLAGLVSALDTAVTMENQLRLVTNSQSELNSVFKELQKISKETRTPLDANVEAFRRLGVATKEIGVSTDTLLDLQKSLNHALIISGSGAQEARAGLIQFSQGLASGKLQGDELRSVLENVPRLGQAIATGLGIPFGKLRDELSKGKITTKQIIEAIASQATTLEDEFGKTTSTIGQGFTQIRSSVLAFVFEFNKATGIANLFAKALGGIARGIDFLTENMHVLGNVIDTLRAGFFGIVHDIDNMFISLTYSVARGVAQAKLAVNKAFNAEVFDEGEITRKFGNVIANTAKNRADAQKFLQKQLAAIVGTDAPTGGPPVNLGADQVDEIDKKVQNLIDRRKDDLATIIEENAALQEVHKTQDLIGFSEEAINKIAKLRVEARKYEGTELAKINAQIIEQIRLNEENLRIIKLDVENRNLDERNKALRMVLAGEAKSVELAELQLKAAQASTDEQRRLYAEQFKKLAVNEELEDQLKRQLKLAEDLKDTFKDTFKDLITGAKSFGEAIDSLAAKLQDLLLNAALEGIAKDIGGSVFGSGSDGSGDIFSSIAGIFTGSEKGNIFRGQEVVPFAKGGLITSPVMFPLKSGIGLAGERGTEAIMPLTRTPSGDLGVRAAGGAGGSITNITLNISTPDADSFRKSQGQILREAQMAASRAASRNG